MMKETAMDTDSKMTSGGPTPQNFGHCGNSPPTPLDDSEDDCDDDDDLEQTEDFSTLLG